MAEDRTPSDVAEEELAFEAPERGSADELLAVMRRDKKARGGLTFVLDGPAGLESVDDPPPAALAM